MIKIKRNVVFDLDAHKDKNNLFPIRMRVVYSGNRVGFLTGLKIEKEFWDSHNGTVLPGETPATRKRAKEYNQVIASLANNIDSLFVRYEHFSDHVPTAGELRTEFNNLTGKTKSKKQMFELEKTWNDFVATMGKRNNWTQSTYNKFSYILTHLKEWRADIKINSLTDKDLQEYVDSLLKKGMRNTTIQKNLSFVRWFLRWAYFEGLYQGTLHSTFKPKMKGTDGNDKEVIHLTLDELLSLYNHEFDQSKQYLERVRDVFCFCCFTGLRYSDVQKLQKFDVKNDKIHVVTQKTVDGIIIELNDYSRTILEKYRKINMPGNKALPVISNSKMNEYLKELGEICSINQPQRIVYFKGNERHEEIYPKYALLTTHCARRTFVVNALLIGIPESVIMEWTGHSDYKAMKPYRKIVNDLKEKEMGKFNLIGKKN